MPERVTEQQLQQAEDVICNIARYELRRSEYLAWLDAMKQAPAGGRA
jgi:hypothetical protein